MDSYKPTQKLPIWKGAALIFESHQYVEIDIFKNPWLFSQEGSNFWGFSGQSPGTTNIFCFLRGLCQLPRRGSFPKLFDNVPITSLRVALTSLLYIILPRYLFPHLEPSDMGLNSCDACRLFWQPAADGTSWVSLQPGFSLSCPEDGD